MPFHTHRTIVMASSDRIWELLVDKIRHPDRYVPGVEQVRILQTFGPLSIEREMLVRAAGRAKLVRELIAADPVSKTVLFKLVDDAVFTGWVLNTVYEDRPHPALEYSLHWQPRPGAVDDSGTDWQAAIQGAVEHTKALAEASVTGA